MRVQRALAATAVLVVAGLALTACQDDVNGTAGAASSSGASSSPAVTASSGATAPGGTGGTGGGSASGGTGSKAPSSHPSSSKASTGSGSGSGTAAAAACTTANLIPDVSAGNAAPPSADMASVTVTFGNKGDTCTLNGFAGVDLATSEDPTSVPRGFKQPSTVTLAKAQIAVFTIWYRTNPKGHPSAKVTTMTITPPGETHSVKMNWPGAGLATGADAGGTDTLYLEPVVLS